MPVFLVSGSGRRCRFHLFSQNLGVAANLIGWHASNLAGTGSVGKIAYFAGPRYTFSIGHGSRLFGEASPLRARR
jgi:hypothetical protein